MPIPLVDLPRLTRSLTASALGRALAPHFISFSHRPGLCCRPRRSLSRGEPPSRDRRSSLAPSRPRLSSHIPLLLMPPSPPACEDLFGPDNDEYARTTPFSAITPAEIPSPPPPDYSAHERGNQGGAYGSAGGGFGRRGRGGRGRWGRGGSEWEDRGQGYGGRGRHWAGGGDYGGRGGGHGGGGRWGGGGGGRGWGDDFGRGAGLGGPRGGGHGGGRGGGRFGRGMGAMGGAHMGGARQHVGPAFQVVPCSLPHVVSVAVLGACGHHDAALKAAKLPTLQKPTALWGFSRLADGSVWSDERCLRRLRPAILGKEGPGGWGAVDLNEGFEGFVEKRDGGEAHEGGGGKGEEGDAGGDGAGSGSGSGSGGGGGGGGEGESGFADVLVGMRWVLKKQVAALQPGMAPDRLHFVTFRNNLNKLMGVCYNRHDAWQMGVHKRLGSVYLHVHRPPGEQQHKSEQQRRFEFYGYAFEHAATEPRKTGLGEGGGEESTVIDANEEFCAVMKTKLGAHRVLMGAEMDCYEWVNVPQPNNAAPRPERIFVELKTSLLPESEGQRERFERDKLLRWWIQSFVGGVGAIVVGFRDTRGRLVKVERWSLGEVTRRVKGKDYWEAGSVLTFTDQVLTWLYGSAQEGGDYVLRFVPGQSRLELAAADGCPAFIEKHCQELAAMGIT
ncbi:unnamed protein product [Closterium sp. NIES-64]|nr:unnamed protein product [Closterium sp. NIES-65]CAI5944083.1 unnamed protein product [Closterium sp. NIES-65]CAI5999636.1 unnamed protein product [Closterium sp. NIES-64]